MGWYDIFHSSDGPTLYTISNRTSVTYDVSIVAVCILFATLFIAFIVIFPGVRKQVSAHSDITSECEKKTVLIYRWNWFIIDYL